MKPKLFLKNLIATGSAKDQKSSFGLQQLFSKRLFLGFRVGEAIAWLLFHISWPALMASIYFITGKFKNPDFMSFQQYSGIQLVVLSCKAFFLSFFWWLFFVRLKSLPLSKKLLLHLLTGPVFTGLCIGSVYFGLTWWLQMPYTSNSMLVDIYNLLFFYCSHFALFHAYNFWLSDFRGRLLEEKLRNLAFQTEIKALKAQMEPHFLFNTLNSISASVPPELEKTRIMISDLADTFRFALKASETESVSLEDELHFIKTWLSLEKQRLKEKLQVTYTIDRQCLGIQIPPMLLQPIIENALLHGIGPKIDGGSVHIECTKQDEDVMISVSDTGVGYEGELSCMLDIGIGLKNTSKRLYLLYGQTLHIERNTTGGLRFWFLIASSMNEKNSLPRTVLNAVHYQDKPIFASLIK